jgi:hypothetical protein
MHPAILNSVEGRMGMLRRFALSTLVGWTMMSLYLFICHRHPGPHTAVPMPAWVPFIPAFIIPYQAMLFMTWLLPVAIREDALFRACIRALICGYLLVMPWWIFAPTMLPRPPLPAAPWAEAFLTLWRLDQPHNIMPCAHGIGPVITAWFAWRNYPRWRWPLVLVLAIGLPSIALVWQHRPIDIFLGTLAALVGIILAEAMIRREQLNSRPVPAEV